MTLTEKKEKKTGIAVSFSFTVLYTETLIAV